MRTHIEQTDASSIPNADYSPNKIEGSLYSIFEFALPVDIESDTHRVKITTQADIRESSSLPPFLSLRQGLFGLSRFKYQYDRDPNTAYTYKTYSFGGGLDIQAKQGVNVRAIDFEYQQWPGYPPNGFAPQVWTIGAAYAFA